MPRFIVTAQYGYTKYYSKDVVVEAPDEESARELAIEQANATSWDDAVESSSGECGPTEVWKIIPLPDTESTTP